MKFVDGRTLEWSKYLLSGVRAENSVINKRLIDLDDGGPNDFDFVIVRIDGEYFAPRHRHNWGQVRCELEGSQNYMPGRDITKGALGYFPEGTMYGPQNVKGPMVQALLQFGGPSGYGYMSHRDVNRGVQELSRTGTFAKGNYETANAQGEKTITDGYEATWAQVKGEPLVYPKAQYGEPILIFPERFDWEPQELHPGTFERHLGVFSNGHVEIRMVKADEGARYVQGGAERRELLFVEEGELTSDVCSLGPQSALYTGEGESLALTVTQAFRGLAVTLPSFARSSRNGAVHSAHG